MTETKQQQGRDMTNWASQDGSFKRQTSAFRDAITRDPNGKFPAEKGRYYLYVSLACPWAHRALIVRKLKGLEDFIPISIVHPHMSKSTGWSFISEGYEGQGSEHFKDGKIPNVIPDPLYNFKYLKDLYFKADPQYNARYTVPTLWDSKTETIVSNESSEIIRFLNDAFDDLVEPQYKGLNFYPEDLRSEIDAMHEWVYPNVNNGVYRSGFATKQEPYLEAVTGLTESMQRLEDCIRGKDYFVGGKLTEVDVRVYTTLIRYDPVYVLHFKCNTGSVRHDYPELNRWLKNLYWKHPAFKDTTDFDHIKIHYYTSHPQINPTCIVPKGPIPAIEPLE